MFGDSWDSGREHWKRLAMLGQCFWSCESFDQDLYITVRMMLMTKTSNTDCLKKVHALTPPSRNAGRPQKASFLERHGFRINAWNTVLIKSKTCRIEPWSSCLNCLKRIKDKSNLVVVCRNVEVGICGALWRVGMVIQPVIPSTNRLRLRDLLLWRSLFFGMRLPYAPSRPTSPSIWRNLKYLRYKGNKPLTSPDFKH